MPLLIRRYVPADHDAVWSLHVRALEAVGARAQNPTAHGLDADFDDIEGTYLKAGGEFLVGVLEAGEHPIIAMGALKQLNGSTGEVTRMRVDPQHWRKGYGEAILHALEAAAIARGHTELWLDTVALQVAAHNLYRKHGYQEFLRVPIRGYESSEAILFRKTIAP